VTDVVVKAKENVLNALQDIFGTLPIMSVPSVLVHTAKSVVVSMKDCVLFAKQITFWTQIQ